MPDRIPSSPLLSVHRPGARADIAFTPRSTANRPGARRWATLLAATLLVATGAARAQDDDLAVDVDTIDSTVTDPAVFRTLLCNTDLTRRTLMSSAIAAALASSNPAQRKSIVPTTAPTTESMNPSLRPIRIDGSAAPASTLFQLDNRQIVQWQANGLPPPNLPVRDSLDPVLPRAVNPADIALGARWGAQDHISPPLLPSIALDAHADVLTGAAPPRAMNVRRSLRITAQWDSPEDIKFGITPGLERGGGTLYEHYVTGLQASTLGKAPATRWRSFIEVSGEKLAPNNIIDNTTATVHAGATYSTSASTQLDVSVSRGTTATSDTQSNVGLSVHF